jgi:hypothetical protein
MRENQEMRPPPVVLLPLKCDECPGIATVTTGAGDKLCYGCGQRRVAAALRSSGAHKGH